MLDILHFLFDEDTIVVSQEHAESQSSVRTAVYQSLYNKVYPYAYAGGSGNTTAGDGFSDDYDFALPDVSNEIKPYIPPTQFDPSAENPFQGTLREAPLG